MNGYLLETATVTGIAVFLVAVAVSLWFGFGD